VNEQEKREKVIKGLECCMGEGQSYGMCDDCPYTTGKMVCNLGTLHQDALMLLKAEEPVEPKKNDVEMCGLRTWEWACPVCNTILVYRANYCSGCGRAVKWE